jgi:hypothetical protein
MTDNLMKPEVLVQAGAVAIVAIMLVTKFLDHIKSTDATKGCVEHLKCLEGIVKKMDSIEKKVDALVTMHDTKVDGQYIWYYPPAATEAIKELAEEMRTNNKLLHTEQTRWKIYNEQHGNRD